MGVVTMRFPQRGFFWGHAITFNIVSCQEWGAEGYQLWLSVHNPEHLQAANDSQLNSASSSFFSPALSTPTALAQACHLVEELAPTNGESSLSTRGSCDFIQLNFVKSPLTVSPCLVSSLS